MGDQSLFTYHITNELTLASLHLDDADTLFSLIQKNKVHLGEWLPWVHHCKSIEAVKTFIQSTQTTYNEQKGGSWHSAERAINRCVPSDI